MDDNQDNICDRCAYEMTRFSVTVPTSLQIAMSPDGDITTADVGAIVNRSTGAVKVSSLQVKTVNGWTLVPYGTDMAHQKVPVPRPKRPAPRNLLPWTAAGQSTRTAAWRCPTMPWFPPALSLSRNR